jgi:L-seryl-tRNA(Ser) seleniumtransferase
MSSSKESPLREIPSVDSLLQDVVTQPWAADVPRRILVDSIRTSVEELRQRLVAGQGDVLRADGLREAILGRVHERVRDAVRPHYRKVINATGIILHTGLGRAVLPASAMRRIENELAGYSLLQVDIATGSRSRRDDRIEWLLQELTRAEAATVVNNNAAATSIVLNTIAKDREVIVSRGQLVEIGGSFRLPDVMAASGAKMVEVGTTNKTHAADYERAITPNTAAILRVHPSNYKIVGFTSEVPLDELVRIAHAHGLPLIDDVGAGALFDLTRFGFTDQPTLPASIRAGADIAISSADKLIGGSQGGLILGKADLIKAIRKNPFARIVRVGKLTLAALEATLMLFLDEEVAFREIPTLRMLTRDPLEIREQAERIATAVRAGVTDAIVQTIDGFSQVELPTGLVAIQSPLIAPEALAERLRRREPAIFTRIHKEHVLVDPRTLLDGEEEPLVRGVVEVLRAEA